MVSVAQAVSLAAWLPVGVAVILNFGGVPATGTASME
jgi:hypothetical protein